MEYHYVVIYDLDSDTWRLDWGETDAKYDERPIFNFETSGWEKPLPNVIDGVEADGPYEIQGNILADIVGGIR